jgi:hypothetical protein
MRWAGVPLVRLSTPESRWNVTATAMLLKQTVITASEAMAGSHNGREDGSYERTGEVQESVSSSACGPCTTPGSK